MSSWVKNEYEEERKRMLDKEPHPDPLTIPMSIRLPASTVAYYSALANRFNKSRNSTMAEILSAQIYDSLKELKPDDRDSVGIMADENYRNLHKEENNAALVGKHFEGIAEVMNEQEPLEDVWHTENK